MRLIDADELINKLNKFESDVHGSAECYSSETEIIEAIEYVGILIDEVKTVETVPVIRCVNCTHWGTGVAGETKHVKCCEYGRYMVGKNGYCCYGEKRDEL